MSYEFALVFGIINVLLGIYCVYQSTSLVRLKIDLRDPTGGIVLSALAGVFGLLIMGYGAWLLAGL